MTKIGTIHIRQLRRFSANEVFVSINGQCFGFRDICKHYNSLNDILVILLYFLRLISNV